MTDYRNQHSPDIRDILPHTKGHSTNYVSSHEKSSPPKISAPTTSRWRKQNRVATLYGIDWYPVFVKNKQLLSLSDVHNDEELNRMFNVCFNIPQPGEEKNRRFFAAFRSPLDFLSYIKKIPPEKWAFFEYILGTQVQKLYFDVDIPMVDFRQAEPGENVDEFGKELVSELVKQIVETFDERGFHIEPAKNILLFTSHSSNKKSFHVVVDGYAVMNNRENYILASEVLEQLPEKYLKFIDTGMWSSKQQFRLYRSQKPFSNRPKIFQPIWYYQGQWIESVIYEHVQFPSEQQSAEALKFTILFLASCISVVQNCQIIPETLPEDEPFTRNSNTFTEDEITSEIVDTIYERADKSLFQIYRIAESKGSLISLLRKVPAHCSLCDSYHTNDNAFLTIKRTGKVYFHCHGVRRHVPRNSSGEYLRETSKYVCEVGDLLPSKEEEIAELHKQSIVQNLIATIPKINNQTSKAPTPTTSLHRQLKELGSVPNIVTKKRNDF
jgi:hypothetical protein